MTPRSSNWLAGIVGLVALLVVTTGLVSAHATLVRANPAPDSVLVTAPAQVQLWFDEEVSAPFSEIQVLDAGRNRVDAGPGANPAGDAKSLVVPLKPLGTGTFSVLWKAFSATDGHVTRGLYAFSIGQPTAGAPTGGEATPSSSETTPLGAVARGASLFALLLLTGAFFFRLALLTPSLSGNASRIAAGPALEARLFRLIAFAVVLGLTASAVELVLQVSIASGNLSPQSFAAVLLGTRPGNLGLARLALLFLIGMLLLARPRVSQLLGTRTRTGLLLLALSALALLTRSLASHGAAAQGDISLAVVSDWIHFLAVSVWVGGLGSLAWILPIAWRALPASTRRAWLAEIIARFSKTALVATPIVALTGIYNAAAQIPSLDALLRTLYGDTLVVKVGLFLAMLALGGIHLLFIGPALERQAVRPESDSGLAARFRLTLGLEILAGLVAVFLAGLLTLQPPARAAIPVAAPPIAASHVVLMGEAAPDVKVQLVVSANGARPNQFDIRVVDTAGQPVADILRVMLNFTLLDSDTGSQTLIAPAQADGSFRIDGAPFAADGMWRIRAIVRRKGLEDASVDFPYYVASAAPRATDPAARALLQNAEARMNALSTLRSTQYLNDGANGVTVTDYQFQSPDRMDFSIRGQGESIAIGPVQYFQDQGQWTAQGRASPYIFPRFDLSEQATWVGAGREENAANGEPAQIVRFSIPNSSGTAGIQYAYWVSKSDRRVLQYAMVTDAHYMFEYYRDYDAADVSIHPPEGVGVREAAATPNPAPAAAPLTSSRRLPGLITGDLEGDGALLLLVIGVVASAFGLIGRAARTSRLTALGMGAACVVAGLGLFLDAARATTTVNNLSVDAHLAAAGKATYQQYCQTCHGAEGKGDGPGSAKLPAKPSDLTAHVLLHDEFYLHDVILNGRGYMPPFGDQLTQDQILQVIAYVRQLAIQARVSNPPPRSTPGP